jgi:hypothetical protein
MISGATIFGEHQNRPTPIFVSIFGGAFMQLQVLMS